MLRGKPERRKGNVLKKATAALFFSDIRTTQGHAIGRSDGGPLAAGQRQYRPWDGTMTWMCGCGEATARVDQAHGERCTCTMLMSEDMLDFSGQARLWGMAATLYRHRHRHTGTGAGTGVADSAGHGRGLLSFQDVNNTEYYTPVTTDLMKHHRGHPEFV